MRLLLLFLLTSSLLSVNATTYYVSNTGSNSNNGLTPGTAFLTIQFAENQCDPGDSVLVANGNYAGFYVNVSGNAANPIVFLANGNAVFITSPTTTTDGINVEGVLGNTVDYIEINGFIVNDMPRNGIRLVYANNCIVRNNFCEGNFERGILTGWTDDILIEYNECSYAIDEHGIYVSNSSDRSIVRYNSCHHNHGGGIQINADGTLPGDGISSDPEIYGNVLYENALNNGGGAAINLDGVQGAFIYNNLLYENHATGIALFQQDGDAPSINATVVYNTIVQASNGRWNVLVVNGATGASIHNNILINQHSFRGSIALSADAFTGFSSDYNVVINSFSDDEGSTNMDFEAWQDLGYDLNSILVDDTDMDEIFVNENAGDYHLLANSVAVNAGSAAFSSGINVDIEGNLRPIGTGVDIGTYEEPSVVLSFEDDEEQKPIADLRWITYTFLTGELIVHGVMADDRIVLSDMTGRIVQSIDCASDMDIHLRIEDLVAGLYVVCIVRERGWHDIHTFMKRR